LIKPGSSGAVAQCFADGRASKTQAAAPNNSGSQPATFGEK
jgi:hypothetical protein